MHPRPQANISRRGPARSGSFEPNVRRGGSHPSRRAARERSNRVDRVEAREPRRELRDARETDRGVDREDMDRQEIADRREDTRQDYYDDRRDYRDDRRALARGARYSAVWWSSNSCQSAVVVEVDGYTYYQCDGAWFSRTYYGGEVTYTVTDAPPGY